MSDHFDATLSLKINKLIRDHYNETNPPMEEDTIDIDETMTALRCIYRGYYAKLDEKEQREQARLLGIDLALRDKRLAAERLAQRNGLD